MANTVTGILLIVGALLVSLIVWFDVRKHGRTNEAWAANIKRIIFILGLLMCGVFFLVGIMDVSDASKH